MWILFIHLLIPYIFVLYVIIIKISIKKGKESRNNIGENTCENDLSFNQRIKLEKIFLNSKETVSPSYLFFILC